MRDLVRQKTSLSEEIEKVLNDQIKQEAKASATYLSMASWCDQHGFANSADFFYYNWIDQFDTLGLGANRPIVNGSFSDSMLVLQPNGEFLVLRVPYPLGFYTRGLDGRIDDPRAGWKGRGVYANYGPNAVWHMEGGKGTLSAVVKFQMRPNPLAK